MGGIETYTDGSKYTGSFLRGAKHGFGTYQTGTGSILFVGVMADDKMHGYGTIEFPDDSKYVGNVTYGLREGVGTLQLANGSSYAGEWLQDQQDGKGTDTDTSG